MRINSSFNRRSFKSYLKRELIDKEFTARQDAFADAFEKYLSKNYIKNIKLFESISGAELQTREGMFIYGWWL